MKITVYYQTGKIDQFDTGTFTTQEPFKAEGINVTTELQLRLDLLKEEGLLLDIFWYDLTAKSGVSSQNEEVGATIAHADRKPGRRVRLVSRSELAGIAKITCDNELLVWRQGSELINGIKFHGQEILCFSDTTTTSINQRAVAIFEYLQKANPGLSDEAVAQMMGYSYQALQVIMADEYANNEADDEDDDCDAAEADNSNELGELSDGEFSDDMFESDKEA